jgi:hypothetical protein
MNNELAKALIEIAEKLPMNDYAVCDAVVDALESQAREIEELKADATERNADHGKLVEENHELRAALVEAYVALNEYSAPYLGYEARYVAALTRCKEVL